MANHQSSNTKIKVIGNHTKFKIDSPSSDYGADGKVVIISAAIALPFHIANKAIQSFCGSFLKKFTPNPEANENIGMYFPLLDILCSFINYN